MLTSRFPLLLCLALLACSAEDPAHQFQGHGPSYWRKQLTTEATRESSLAQLSSAGAAARPLVEALLADKDPAATAAACRVIARAGTGFEGSSKTLAALAAGENAIVASSAIAAMESIGPTCLPDLFDQYLQTGDPDKSTAMLSVMKLMDPDCIPLFVSRMDDRDDATRRRATRALEGLGALADVDARWLASHLRDTDPGVRTSILNTLSDRGPKAGDAIPALETFIQAADMPAGERVLALWALGHMGEAAGARREFLEQGIRQEANPLRPACIDSLGRVLESVGGPGVEVIAGALGPTYDAASEEVYQALIALGEKAAPATAAVSAHLKDDDDVGPMRAAETLGAIGPRAAEAVPELALLAASERQERAESAAEALGKIGPASAPAVPALEKLLEREGADVARIATALAGIGPGARPALEGLQRHLDDTEINARRAVATAIGAIGPDAAGALDALFRVVRREGEHEAVCREAAIAVARVSPDPIGDLRPLLDAKTPAGRAGAAYAFRVLGDKAVPAADRLIQIMSNPAENIQVRLAAASTLGQIPGAKGDLATAAAKLYAEPKTPPRLSATVALAVVAAGGDASAGIPFLASFAADPAQPADERGAALDALAAIRTPQTIKVVVHCLDDPAVAPAVRKAIASSGEVAVGPMVDQLSSPDWRSRRDAARTLALLGEPAIAAVSGGLDSKDIHVVRGAAYALRLMRSHPAALAALARVKDHPDSVVRWAAGPI